MIKRFPSVIFLFVAVLMLVNCGSTNAIRDPGTSTSTSTGAIPQGRKDSLALFPLTGSSREDGEAIVSSLARQRVLRDAFNRITLVTRNSMAAIEYERRIQEDSKLTDPDTIFEFGREMNAAFVMAGYITSLGNQNLVVVSILDVESLQQVAGDYRAYSTIEEIDALIPDMARKLAASLQRDTSSLPGLSVPPFTISEDVNRNDAQVLAQMLSCDLANEGRYAVLPRTDSLDKVMDEHRRQRSGVTDPERVKRLGIGRNARFVLSGSVERIGNLNKLTADIHDIEDDSFLDGHEERYSDFFDGMLIIPKLAAYLSGVAITGDNFIRVAGGTFQMGSNDGGINERPVHTVTIKSFSMSMYLVTQKEYREVMGDNPSLYTGDNFPVGSVTWYNAVEFCNLLSLREGLTPVYTIHKDRQDINNNSDDDPYKWAVSWNRNADGYRLPTEAEWEYAAKGGNGSPGDYVYSGSNYLDEVAWYEANSGGNPQEVGTLKPNILGLYDMSGNVWEWCWDWYGDYFGGPQTDPVGTPSGSSRVIRGGSYFRSAERQRSAYRNIGAPSNRYYDVGFRLVR